MKDSISIKIRVDFGCKFKEGPYGIVVLEVETLGYSSEISMQKVKKERLGAGGKVGK